MNQNEGNACLFLINRLELSSLNFGVPCSSATTGLLSSISPMQEIYHFSSENTLLLPFVPGRILIRIPCDFFVPFTDRTAYDITNRLLKNGHLRGFPRPSSLRSTAKYASLLRISGALHLVSGGRNKSKVGGGWKL